MSEPKRKAAPHEDTEPVDWGERLRASMDADRSNESADVRIHDEDEELQELLRAQLAMLSQDPAFTGMPDISDFEDDEDDYEDDEDLADEDDYEDDEDLADEDDYEDDEDLADENDYEDDEDLADENDYEDDEDLADEDDPVDEEDRAEGDASLAAEDTAECAEKETRPIAITEAQTEGEAVTEPLPASSEARTNEAVDESKGRSATETVPSPAGKGRRAAPKARPKAAVDHEVQGVSRLRGVVPVLGDTVAPPPLAHATDGILNGRIGRKQTASAEASSDDSSADGRRWALRAANARLLREVELRRSTEWYGAEPIGVSSEPPASDAEGKPTEEAAHDSPAGRAAISYDPLQIDREGQTAYLAREAQRRSVAEVLDEEMDETRKGMEEPSPALPRPEDYTGAMVSTSERDLQLRDAELLADLGYSSDIKKAEDRRTVEEAYSERLRRENAYGGDTVPQPLAETETPVPPSPPSNETATKEAPLPETNRTRYKKHRRAILLRALLASVGALLMLAFDSLPLLLKESGGGAALFDTITYPIVSVVLTALLALPFATRLWRGLTGLFGFIPRRYSAATLALLVHFLYTALAVVTSLLGEGPLPLFGGPALCTLAIAALSEHLDAVGERDAWELMSAGKPISVLTDEPTPATMTLCDDRPDDLPPLTAVHTRRVERRAIFRGACLSDLDRLNSLLPAALGVAVLCALITLFCGEDATLVDVARVFTVAFLSALPSAYLVAVSAPLGVANRRLSAHGSAVTGAAASDTYAGDPKRERVVCFYDGDIIRATRRKEIIPHSSKDPDALPDEHWKRLSNRLFHLLHSPLATEDRFEDDASPDALAYLHAEIVEQSDSYLKLYLIDDTPGSESTLEIMMGSHEALTGRGVRLTPRERERDYCRSEDSHVLYIAVDGRFRMAYAAEYRVRKDLAVMADALARCHARPAMVTYDPLLTPYALSQERFDALRSVQILRPDHVETVRRTCSGGVVALGDERDLIHPLLASRCMRQCYRRAYGLSWIALGIAAALLVTAVLCGRDDLLHPVTAALFHVLYTVAAVLLPLPLITRRALMLPKKQRRRPDRSRRRDETDEEP